MDDDGASHKEHLHSKHGPSDGHEDIFQSIGDQFDSLKESGEVNDTDNGCEDESGYENDNEKLVDEIESLCMNCGENVGFNRVTGESSTMLKD